MLFFKGRFVATLKKELGPVDVFSIAAGAMISSGLFVLPGLAFAKAGPAIIVAYALAGLFMVPALLAKAELVTAMPRSGGSYFFVERSLGPLVGTIAGFSIWLAIALKATFAMVGIGALASTFLDGGNEWVIKLVAVIGCLIFMTINILSVKSTGRFQIVLVFGLLAILLLYVARGLTVVDGTSYMPFAPNGMLPVFAVTGMVFVSFGGLTKVVDVSEEVRNSKKNVPLGMFSAFIVVCLLYIAVVFVTIGIVSSGKLSGSLIPITLGGQALMGKIGAVLISIAALLAFATTGNAGILSASRTPMAMSRDGLLPGYFSQTSRKFKTPHIAIIITTFFMLVIIACLSIENLVKVASTIQILMFMLMNASVVIMRHSGMQSYRPKFKAPWNPWLQIATILVYIFLIFEMGYVPLIMTACFALAAVIWYLFYIQRRIERESAIVYLVRRVVSKQIQRSGLEEELKQIALERDEVTPDRFDKLINDCVILDIEGSIGAKELFERAADCLSPRLGIEAGRLYELFIAREKESATVIEPGLAIPHIVVEGSNIFDVLLVRCKEGVIFSELGEPVKTAFILIGSSDERNYHLRALMSVAHIVSEPDFKSRWFQARNIEQLRDIVLLSGRKREI